MNATLSAYQKLEQRFHQMNMLESVSGLLGWDAATYMPTGSAELRGEQLATLADIHHQQISAEALEELLNTAEQGSNELDEWQQANLREMRHSWVHQTCLDGALVIAIAKKASESESIWREAKETSDFKRFAPHQKEMLSLIQESAAAKAEALGCSPYDALLDSYDPGMRTTMIDEAFAPLEAELPDLINQVIAKQAAPSAALNLASPIAAQEKLATTIMQLLGFDFSQGRQDTSAHPFCGGVPSDIRITTRYNEGDFTEGMFGVLHETGHALYEAGLPTKWCRQPVGHARGMSMHESQSLFVEMQLSRSKNFIEFLTPHVKQSLGKQNEAWNSDDLYKQVTRVERSLIRVNADEVTYPTHVMLRYRLEKQLLSGALEVVDLPDAWSDGLHDLLGIRPTSHATGCMQDIHWPEGALGYFPTYTLGAMIAAQLFDSMNQQIPDLGEQIQKGELATLQKWLGENIHAVGSRFSTQEMLKNATGKPLDASLFLQHLRNRYLS